MVDRGCVGKILIIICRSKKRYEGMSQTIRLVRDGTEKGGGGIPGRLFLVGGGYERCGSYEINTDSLEFSWKNGFRVYETILKVKKFEWATLGNNFLINLCKSVTFCWNERIGDCNPLFLAVVKNLEWHKFSQETQWTPWGIGVGQRAVLIRSNQSGFKIQLNTVNR